MQAAAAAPVSRHAQVASEQAEQAAGAMVPWELEVQVPLIRVAAAVAVVPQAVGAAMAWLLFPVRLGLADAFYFPT